jgi:hypothetical protein
MLSHAQSGLKGETPQHAGAGWGTLRGVQVASISS